MDHRIAAEHSGPVDISRPAAIVALLWCALIVELGVLALAVGWAPGAPVSRVLDVLLWPGSLVAFVALGALPRRGGLLLGLVGGTLVGLTCAIVVAMLPDAQLPLAPASTANRVYFIIEAVWVTPVIGMLLGFGGLLLRRGLAWPTHGTPRPKLTLAARWVDPEPSAVSGDIVPAPTRPGFAPMGLAMAAGAAVSLQPASASRDLAAARR